MSNESLKPWREVIEPHPDVSSGKYQQAEFAADLAQVIAKRAEPEYQNPKEFFARTYITNGLKDFLQASIKRISGDGGDPIIQLKTSFGGGKTHTMLALYHLLDRNFDIKKSDSLEKVFPKDKSFKIPKANIAVLVGTAISVTQPTKCGNVNVKTLWGYMAAQLGGEKAYALIKKDDDAGTAPGSTTLIELFSKFGPAVIIIDELARYASNIFGNSSSGLNCSFDSLVDFCQGLTEAVKDKSTNTLVVASIPQSDIEKGGEAGMKASKILENTFGRVVSIWKPVQPTEGFEIVRRRLFKGNFDESMRERVCEAFNKMYKENDIDFPSKCKELDYLKRLKSSYPIHPEVFDRLYDDWTTIDIFQETRGVLRLMAAAIHNLWIDNDKSLMIMPGSLPIGAKDVHAELTRYLDDQWNPIMSSDVDGNDSLPRRIDEDNPRFGAVEAARRVARTIFLGSAPSTTEQNVRGLDIVRVRLGVIQPGEQIPIFNDVMEKLTNTLVHLYGENGRFWYDTRANLRRTVEDRASSCTPRDIADEVRTRLNTRERGRFSRVQVCPSSDDVLDEQEIKLIVLPMDIHHKSSSKDSPAIKRCNEILDKKGNVSRQYKNMLIFVCADEDLSKDLEYNTRQHLAWKSVDADAEKLDLKAAERKQAKEFTYKTDQTLKNKVFETYCWLLVPSSDGTLEISWEDEKIPGNEDYSVKATKKLKDLELLVTQWSPALLKMELEKWIWKNEPQVNVKKLWSNMTSYLYFTRLCDEKVLIDAIQEGLKSKDFFAYASDVDGEGKYLGLAFGKDYVSISLDDKSVLIKPEIAAKQVEVDKPTESESIGSSTISDSGHQELLDGGRSSTKTRFHGTVSLDWETLPIKAGEISSEIIGHLKALKNSNVEIILEISGTVPDGLSDEVIRTLSENCKTLKFLDWEFHND